MVTGPALMYAGPRDGARYEAPEGATEMPEHIGVDDAESGRYCRLDCMPGWMSFLPQRSLDTTIYVWEDAYVV